ncbi:MAG: hypothetical protein QOJ16_478, partial [Acidobacteriota bacterium]|nr:hypothetical protein [Acidobacteriota bacterium]
MGRGGEQAVEHRQGIWNIETAPLLGDRLVDWQDAVLVGGDQLLEPGVQVLGGGLVPAPDVFD